MSLERVRVKEEAISEDECYESEPAPSAGWYRNHEVKVELNSPPLVKIEVEIGPELIQPQDVAYSIQGPVKEEPLDDKQDSTLAGAREAFTHVSRSGLHSKEHSRIGDTHQQTCLTKHSYVKPKKETTRPSAGRRVANTKKEKLYKESLQSDPDKNLLVLHHNKKPTGENTKSSEVLKKQTVTNKRKVSHDLSDSDKPEKTPAGRKPQFCPICHKRFFKKYNLNHHLLIHTGEKPFSCDVCNKQFRYKSYLVQHKKLHTGDKPYSCKICQKEFAVRANLTKHMPIHSDEKPFSCDICNKGFGNYSNLIKHKRLHTGEKPHCCQTCNKRFTEKANLTKHMMVHTGARPHCCHSCDRQFLQKSNLTKHIMRIHPGVKPL